MNTVPQTEAAALARNFTRGNPATYLRTPTNEILVLLHHWTPDHDGLVSLIAGLANRIKVAQHGLSGATISDVLDMLDGAMGDVSEDKIKQQQEQEWRNHEGATK